MTDPLYQTKTCPVQATGKRYTLFFLASPAHRLVRNNIESGNKSSLTVSDVKVMHIPPKPFRASAMNISTDKAATITTTKKKIPLDLLGWRGKGGRALRALVLTRKNLSGSTP